MGESERYLGKNFKRMTIGDDNNALMALIGINAMIFISLGMIEVIYYMTSSTNAAFQYQIMRYFIVPAKLQSLVFIPWTLLSYMFVHTGILYMLVTMLWLWVFGSIFQTVSDNNKTIPLYIYGGFGGAIIFIGVSYLIPSIHDGIAYSTMFGANASIMAIAIAATTLTPNYRLFQQLNGGIPLWILTLLYIIIDVAGSGGTAHHLAHIGGGLTGYLFILSYKKGYDWSKWMNDVYNWFIDLCSPDKKDKKQATVKDKIFYNTGSRKPFEKKPVVTEQRIDQILDKINQKGFDHLTEEEKTILKKAKETDY
ncbi:MAG: rhomboid family intramembrane serine protease [Ginsengibacter sp.]|jgi:membrane associated rhomboid family serine protease